MSGHNFKVYSDKRPKRPTLSKPKNWSHQDDLRALKDKEIVIRMLNGESIMGTLVEADQYTIKIRQRVSNSVMTVFKHALAYIAE